MGLTTARPATCSRLRGNEKIIVVSNACPLLHVRTLLLKQISTLGLVFWRLLESNIIYYFYYILILRFIFYFAESKRSFLCSSIWKHAKKRHCVCAKILPYGLGLLEEILEGVLQFLTLQLRVFPYFIHLVYFVLSKVRTSG